MVINTGKDGWEKELLKQEMNIVANVMNKKFFKIFDDTFRKYALQWYEEFTPSVYPRIDEFANKIQYEIKPYIEGNSIVCGIEFKTDDLTRDTWTNRYGKDVKRYESKGTTSGVYTPEKIMEDALLKGGHGFYEYTDTKPYKDMEEELTKDPSRFINELKSELSKNGFIVM